MRNAMAAFVMAVACGGAALQTTAGPRSFRIAVPSNVESMQTHLLLLDVVTPQNQPIILRAYALGRDSSKVYLGSTALPGLSQDASGTRSVDTLRINVTSPLRSWRKATPSADTVEIQLMAFTSGSVAFDGAWSVRSVKLVHPQ